ncbi:MAG: zinc ABC transporter substrate-binding protein [Clostridia bacterium]|nr:zinc ABC transporter substrate-binding protein [Clostridia bacterium]
MLKRFIILLLCLFLLTGCSASVFLPPEKDKLQIVATLFPQYDFAKTIAGDLADVTLLLPPGAESHSFEPSPADIIAINQADLFIYTGESMEAWVSPILDALEGEPVCLDISAELPIHSTVHETVQGEAHHDHNIDPHVFTNPVYAMKMANSISDALCKIDPDNYAVYEMNATHLHQSLAALDQTFRLVIQNGKRNKLIFGGRFAFSYFTEEYGLSYDAALNSCSSDAEPAAADIARLIETVRKENIPVIYYEELSDPKTARLICEETGAKPLLLHSCHNISKEELAQGATYLSLMQKNAEHLKEGLN